MIFCKANKAPKISPAGFFASSYTNIRGVQQQKIRKDCRFVSQMSAFGAFGLTGGFLVGAIILTIFEAHPLENNKLGL